MSHSVLAAIAHDAARYGFFKSVETDNGKRKVAWVIKCSKCPRQFSAYWVANTLAELMAKNMKIRQWDVGRGERPLCPDCSHPRADKHPAEPKANLIDHYSPPPTAIVSALERAVGAKMPKLIEDQVGFAYAHILDVEQQSGIALKNGTSLAAVGKETSRQNLFTHGELKPPDDLVPVKRKLDVSNRKPRGPDKQPRKRRNPFDYAHEFDDRKFTPYPETPKPIATVKEADEMNANSPTPKPKIAHAVFQLLDGVFDSETCLYKNGYTDQRVAADCGTSEDVVAYLRKETFGDLAEDPRISALREDLELVRMEMTDIFKKLNSTYDALTSRIEQIAQTTKSR